MPGMSGMSSAVRGLMPKSSGGRAALGTAAYAGAGYGIYKNSQRKGTTAGRVVGGVMMGDAALGVGIAAGRMIR